MKWPLNAMLILAGIFLMFLLLLRFFSFLWSFLIAIAIRSSQLSACLMKHHYIITGILGRVSGKPASQLFLIARHTHNWAFYQEVQIPALSCNIPKDCVFFFFFCIWSVAVALAATRDACNTLNKEPEWLPLLFLWLEPVETQHRLPTEQLKLEKSRGGFTFIWRLPVPGKYYAPPTIQS